MLTDKHGDFYEISEGLIVRLSAAICAAALLTPDPVRGMKTKSKPDGPSGKSGKTQGAAHPG
jgi:hypothetical protein